MCALVPDPSGPGRRAQIETALGKRLAVLGPEVPWHEAAVSASRARATLALAKDGRVAANGRGPLAADDHRLALLLAADPRLVADLAADALAPLDSETKTSRERLTATLLAWLALGGRTEQVAEALHVHPQTVRYRLGRLRDLYGDRLEDPDSRFELELALRSAPSLPRPDPAMLASTPTMSSTGGSALMASATLSAAFR